VLKFPKVNDASKKQDKVPDSSAHKTTKRSPHQAQLAKFEDEAIPWSFESITYDSGGKKICVVNTCAHDTLLMALFWLREHNKSLGPLIRAEGELLNVVLDNIKRKNHEEARIAWIDHCAKFVPPGSTVVPFDVVTKSRDHTDTIVTRWNCECMIPDSTRLISMFRMKIAELFETCSMLGDNCPCKPVYDAKLNIAPGETRYIEVNMKDFHKIQLEKIDRYFHSGVDARCGQGAFFCNNVDTGCVEATTVRLCDGVRKKRNDIDPLPQIIMIHVGDTDFDNCEVKCMNNIEHRLLIHGKYYNLVQVVLYGGPSHFRGVTVLNGRYIMYDGIRAFGKERNRVKYLGRNTPFNNRGNDYYVSNLWYTKEVPVKPANTPTKYSQEEREAMEREDNNAKEKVRVAQWVRRPKDDYKNHPSYQSLIKKYGQMPGGYWNLDGWKGYEDARTLYITYIGNGKKLPKITDSATTAPGQRELIGTEIGNPDDDSVEEIKSTGEDTIDRLIDDMNINTKGEWGEADLINQNERRARRGSRKRKQTEKIAAYNREGKKKKGRLSLGIHVGKVSEKGKVPRCLYCRGDIENRGEWHMIKVSKSGPEERWGQNEHHFHFKCAKGGLDENVRDVNQLLAIVRSENNIGQDEKR
jgi:hypothetical protein